MDPPMVINDPSFSPSRCSAELWHFPNSGAGGIGLRMPSSLISGFHAPPALSLDESTLTHQTAGTPSGRNKRKPTPITPQDHSSRLVSTTTSADHLNNESAKRTKASAVGEENHDNCSNAERETSSQSNTKPEPPKDYIHVRARRGQATDSHSLAERARREKISERMKILQDLVPGCNKVIGKALVLDEIINYVQSLQHQVEFLSMKLEAVNSRMKPAIEGFPSKDLAAPSFDASALIFSQQEPREYSQVILPEWLHMQFGSSFGRAT